ncbi:MAG: hypothetical protein AAF590_04225 [Pseudomonadota bacterium]
MTNQTEDRQELTTGLRGELELLQDNVSKMTGGLTQELAKALIHGKELDGLLQKFILSQANSALNSATNDAFGLLGGAAESLVGHALGGIGGAAANIFNVSINANDPASFRNSETQIAASLSRAVARGQRGL